MAMTRDMLHRIATLRRREAVALLRAGHYPGAYYLAGYAVECALKACIAKQTKKYDFPDKVLAQKVYTHNLQELVKLAGLSPDLNKELSANPPFQVNWAIVKDWSEASRYDPTITKAQARDLYSACNTRRNGVVPWIRNRW